MHHYFIFNANAGDRPMTVAYTRYVLDVANTKSLLHLTVATSPCSLGYAEIAARIKANISQEELDRNPYKQWIEEYSSPIFTEVSALIKTYRSVLMIFAEC